MQRTYACVFGFDKRKNEGVDFLGCQATLRVLAQIQLRRNEERIMQNIGQYPEYQTTEFYVACFLRHLGYRLLRMDGPKGQRVFVFEDTDTREEDVMRYYNDEARIPPLAYSQTIRDMKQLLYST
jgi:hypothetical protein